MSATTEIQDFNKRVRLTNAGVQALSGTTDNLITWDTETMDTDSMHEGVTNPSRITINTAGDYVVGASVLTTTALQITVKINVGAVPVVIAEFKNSPGLSASGSYIKAVYTFAQGDYIYVTVNPHAAGSLAALSSFFAYRIG